jgi:hypothetical protein
VAALAVLLHEPGHAPTVTGQRTGLNVGYRELRLAHRAAVSEPDSPP